MAREIGETREIKKNGAQSYHTHNFPFVGIGASPVGLDAFKLLLEAIPVDSNMSYVVVQHLNTDNQSHLPEKFFQGLLN